jgi:predicted dehydrogenase
VHSGELGDIQFVDSVRINLGLVQRDVNVLWDLAPHDLSILDFILPGGVTAAGGGRARGRPDRGRPGVRRVPDAAGCAGGAIAHVHVNWLSPVKVRTTTIGGSKRTVVWDDLNPAQRISIYDRGVDLADPARSTRTTGEQAIVSYRSGDMVAPALQEKEALQGVMNEFAGDASHRPHAGHRRLRPGCGSWASSRPAQRSLRLGGTFVTLEQQP